MYDDESGGVRANISIVEDRVGTVLDPNLVFKSQLGQISGRNGTASRVVLTAQVVDEC